MNNNSDDVKTEYGNVFAKLIAKNPSASSERSVAETNSNDVATVLHQQHVAKPMRLPQSCKVVGTGKEIFTRVPRVLASTVFYEHTDPHLSRNEIETLIEETIRDEVRKLFELRMKEQVAQLIQDELKLLK